MSTPPRRKNDYLQDKFVLSSLAVAAVSATETILLGTADGDYVVDRFELEAPGGYASDAANYYVITLQAGSTVLGTWSTLTGANGSLVDAVMNQATLASPSVGASGDLLKVVLTKHASAANLPAQTVFVAHCRQL